MRRLMVRHPPNIDQRTAALFLQLGHHDALTMRLAKIYQQRWSVICAAIDRFLPRLVRQPSQGGTSVWLTGSDTLDATSLARRALAAGVVIEPGAVYFAQSPPPQNRFRLGFSSIPTDRIEPGIRVLADLISL